MQKHNTYVQTKTIIYHSMSKYVSPLKFNTETAASRINLRPFPINNNYRPIFYFTTTHST